MTQKRQRKSQASAVEAGRTTSKPPEDRGAGASSEGKFANGASFLSNPFAAAVCGALLGIAGTWGASFFAGQYNAALELAKQRNAALVDLWSFHSRPGATQSALDLEEATREVRYLTLASPQGVKAMASFAAECTNNLSERCRRAYMEQIYAARLEYGEESVNKADLLAALNGPFDRMENALQTAVDNGEISLPPPGNRATERDLVYFGPTTTALPTDLLKASETDTFRRAFPTDRFAVVMIAELFSDHGQETCVARVGVSRRSIGTKNPRIPGKLFFAMASEPAITPPVEASKITCLTSAMQRALSLMMQDKPEDLAQESARSL